MTYRKNLNHYQRTSVETASKMELVIMCYEKAIQSLTLAKSHFRENRYEDKGAALQKALTIINELQSCLDFEKGGQIARNLDALYNYLTRRLLQGDIGRDISAFDEAIRILGELKGAWDAVGSGDPRRPESIPHSFPDRTYGAGLAA